MPFRKPSQAPTVTASPAEMYRDLPPRPDAVPGLWAHQSEMLSAFAEHTDKSDVALELPTGTGKTLTGLLVAEWTRRTRRSRVIYACPTKQLAKQVVAAANREAIETALLIDTWSKWPEASVNAYEAAQQIAVTTYSSIFNSNPHLAEADLILFDDAHAGEQYVGEAYGVTLKRWESPDEYAAVLGAVAPALDGVFLERLREPHADPSIGADTRLIVPLRQPGMVEALDAVLADFDAPLKYRYAMIRAGLASCLVYVAYSGILVRPYIPPTHQNRLFTNARQRVYLSATLGEGGELERAFGRLSIHRLPAPKTAPRYGRRFFVFPEFVDGVDSKDLARDVVKAAGKALVLAPRKDVAEDDASTLAQPKWPVYGVKEVADGMEPFAKLKHGVCGLAARYDGLDLPGDACRVVVLDGVPDQDNLQERFLQTRARAGAAIAARVRTRVIQGAGRCTRGPQDTAVVLILGSDLSRYLSRPEVADALDPELQAEVSFGRENSQAFSPADVMANIEAFLHQDSDDTWLKEAEPYLGELRRDAVKKEPAGTTALASAVADEVRAWEAATAGSWVAAATRAHEVARLAGGGGRDTAGYRAFWMYLEAVWSDHAAEAAGDQAGRAAAAALVRQAEQVQVLGSWVRQMAPFPAMDRSPLMAADATAVAALTAQLVKGVNQGAVRRKMGETHVGLGERSPAAYEPALTQLGKFVGADAFKPQGKGRCDSVWLWGNDMWLALEAKSDHDPTGVVPHKEVRQANDQLRLLASDRGIAQAPVDSATVIISPKPGVDTDGANGAEAHVHLAAPALVSEIAYDVEAAWEELLTKAPGRQPTEARDLVASVLASRGILPTQLRDRLTQDPVNGTAA